MKIISVTIQNYRSITSAKKVLLEDYTCLVGPNNEGKSNILRALACAMNALREFRRVDDLDDADAAYLEMRRRESVRFRRDANSYYDYERDYPIQLRDSRASSTSVTLEFELSAIELEDFRRIIGSQLNGTLPIRIDFGPGRRGPPYSYPQMRIPKQGRGNKTLNAKVQQCAMFIARRVRFEYIPAIRTSRSARAALDKVVSEGIRKIERSDEYRKAVDTIYELQKEYLNELSGNVLPTLRSFMPSVSNFLLKGDRASRFRSVREQFDILVDDGVETDIEFKGDGVQSLVALALMRHVADEAGGEESTIVAIEEPESHLHPEAIRDLSSVVQQLSQTSQVLVSTHSPILVKWGRNASCVLVEKNKAKLAKSASEVRKSLGIILSDNMVSAEHVLFVEGQADLRLISHFIQSFGSRGLRSKFSSGMFKIVPLGGASKLQSALYRSSTEVLGVHAFLDADDEAWKAAEKAIEAQLINKSAVTFCTCKGMRESEIEDLIHLDFYLAELKEKYMIHSGVGKLRSSKKFSLRLKEAFLESGKIFDQQVEDAVKTLVVDLVVKSEPSRWLVSEKSAALENLLAELELKFKL